VDVARDVEWEEEWDVMEWAGVWDQEELLPELICPVMEDWVPSVTDDDVPAVLPVVEDEPAPTDWLTFSTALVPTVTPAETPALVTWPSV